MSVYRSPWRKIRPLGSTSLVKATGRRFSWDQFESSSPKDPAFWVMHPTLERLLQVRAADETTINFSLLVLILRHILMNRRNL